MGSAREILAANMKAIRAEKAWSQEKLALESGLHRTFIAHVELRTRNVSIDNIERIAEALDVSVARLLTANSSEELSTAKQLEAVS